MINTSKGSRWLPNKQKENTMNNLKVLAAVVAAMTVGTTSAACTGAWLKDSGKTYFVSSIDCETKVVGKVQVSLVTRGAINGDSFSMYKAVSPKSNRGVRALNISKQLPSVGMVLQVSKEYEVVTVVSIDSMGIAKLSKSLPAGTVLLLNGEAIGLSQGTAGMQVIPISL